MRTKEELLKGLGVGAEYNPHGGIVPDTKEIALFEILIDLRDILEEAMHGPDSDLNQIVKRC